MMRNTATILIGAILLGACDSDGGAAPIPDVAVTDSAGIEIAVNASIPPIVHADSLPDRVIRRVGLGDAAVEFGQVSAGLLQSDGRVVVIDFQSREVLLHSESEGLRAIASRGSGPGEVEFPVGLQSLEGDSLAVYDRRSGRVTVFDHNGSLTSSTRLEGLSRIPFSLAVANDEYLVAAVGLSQEREVISRSDYGSLGRSPLAIVRLSLEGSVTDTVAVLQGYLDIDMAGSSVSPVWGVSLPFAVSAGGMLAEGSGESPTVHIWDIASGQIEREIRLPLEPRPVNPSALLDILRSDPGLPGASRMRREDFPMLDSAFLPEMRPFYKDLRLFDGAVWIGSAEPFRTPSRTWRVVNAATGAWTNTVVLPTGSLLLDVRSDTLLVRRETEMGVHFLELIDLAELLSDR